MEKFLTVQYRMGRLTQEQYERLLKKIKEETP